jgi:LemA protein
MRRLDEAVCREWRIGRTRELWTERRDWMSWGILIAIVVVGLLALWIGGTYNRLVVLRNRYKAGFSQIDVQLKRRHDLIPNLVETAKGYMAHERGTLEDVIQARNAAVTAGLAASANPGDPAAMAGLAAAESQLNGVLGRLFAVAEAYPDLKANQNMLALQDELRSTENQIAGSRQTYNDTVLVYNTNRETFPNSLIANAFNFAEAKLFEVDVDKERQAPRVAF